MGFSRPHPGPGRGHDPIGGGGKVRFAWPQGTMTHFVPPVGFLRIGPVVAPLLVAGLAHGAPPAAPADPAADPAAVTDANSVPAGPVVTLPDAVRTCVARHGEAQEHRLEGRLVEARRALVECGRAECPGPVRADCAAWEAEVARSIPTVVVAARSRRGDEVAVRVLVDGTVLRERLDGGAIEVNPGARRFRFELVGERPIELFVLVHEGEKHRLVEVDFSPPSPPPPTEPEPEPEPAGPVARTPALAWWLGGAALAGAVVGTGFGVSALETRDEHRRQCAPLCTADDEREVRGRARAADVSFGVALIAAGAAVVLVLEGSEPRYRRRGDAALTVEGGAVPGGGAVGLRGRF